MDTAVAYCDSEGFGGLLPPEDSCRDRLFTTSITGFAGVKHVAGSGNGAPKDFSEMIELAKIAAKYNGKYKSHIRSEDRRYWEAIEEIIEIGRQAKIPVNIDHFKLNGTFNWGRTDEILSILESARV